MSRSVCGFALDDYNTPHPWSKQMEVRSIDPLIEDALLEALEMDRQADQLANQGQYVLADERRDRAARLRARAEYVR
jgi:hypothetical protein